MHTGDRQRLILSNNDNSPFTCTKRDSDTTPTTLEVSMDDNRSQAGKDRLRKTTRCCFGCGCWHLRTCVLMVGIFDAFGLTLLFVEALAEAMLSWNKPLAPFYVVFMSLIALVLSALVMLLYGVVRRQRYFVAPYMVLKLLQVVTLVVLFWENVRVGVGRQFRVNYPISDGTRDVCFGIIVVLAMVTNVVFIFNVYDYYLYLKDQKRPGSRNQVPENSNVV